MKSSGAARTPPPGAIGSPGGDGAEISLCMRTSFVKWAARPSQGAARKWKMLQGRLPEDASLLRHDNIHRMAGRFGLRRRNLI
jgi:hypothetical protein